MTAPARGQAHPPGGEAPLLAYLRLMARRGASDLFFSPGAPVHIKVAGVTAPLGRRPLRPGAVLALAAPLLDSAQRRRFARTLELNAAVSVPGAGRFRLSLYRAGGRPAMVARHLRETIPSLDELQLPPAVKELALASRGLVLIAGATGAGKTTTLAALIDHRNVHVPGHIVTVEEPVEYLHRHRRAVIDQREVGVDTLSYAAALKNAMRQAPDVIAIGEIRDRRAVRHALQCAETGHLCLATLHAGNAAQAVQRCIDAYEPGEQASARRRLAAALNAVVTQRLMRTLDGGRRPAVELLINSAYVSTLIDAGDTRRLAEAMARGQEQGMQTFQRHVSEMYAAGVVGLDEALAHADSRGDLLLRLRLGPAGG